MFLLGGTVLGAVPVRKAHIEVYTWSCLPRVIRMSPRGAVTIQEMGPHGIDDAIVLEGLRAAKLRFEPWPRGCLQAVAWTIHHMEVILCILPLKLFFVYTSRGHLHGRLKDRICFLTQAVEIMTLGV